MIGLCGPLRWLCNKAQALRRCLQDLGLQEFHDCMNNLDDCPELFTASVSLTDGLQGIRVAVGLLRDDFTPGTLEQPWAVQVLNDSLEQSYKILRREQAAVQEDDAKDWRD